MPGTVDIIIFGMEASVRLGQRVLEIYQDDLASRDIAYPLAESTGPFTFEGALQFFRTRGSLFVEEGAVYHDLWTKVGPGGEAPLDVQDRLQKAAAYVDGTLIKAQHLERIDEETLYKGMVASHAVAQWKRGDPRRPPTSLQRIAQSVLEIGLDHVRSDASFLSGDSKSKKIVRSLLLGLESIDFTKQSADTILLDLFRSSMAVFYDNVNVIIDDPRLSLLVREIGSALKTHVDNLDEASQILTARIFGRDALQGIVEASARVVKENLSLYLGDGDKEEKRFVSAVLKALLGAVQKRPDLFSGNTVVTIYEATLGAVAQNAALLLREGDPERFLAYLLASMSEALTAHKPGGLFHRDMLREVVLLGLEATGKNVRFLVKPEKPEEQLLSDALRRILLAFSDDFAENETLTDTLSGLLSRDHLIRILGIAFDEISRNPERLLGSIRDDDARSVLAQIVGSVTAAIAVEPGLVLTGEDVTKLIKMVFFAHSRNPDRLIDLKDPSPKTNILYQMIIQIIESVSEDKKQGGRHLLTGDWLLAVIDDALSVVSKNINAFCKNEQILRRTLDKLLYLAAHSHADSLDAESLVALFRPVLTTVFEDASLLEDDDRFLSTVSGLDN